MNVTVPESVARAMFTCTWCVGRDLNDHDCGNFDSIRWLVVPEPLVCGWCDGCLMEDRDHGCDSPPQTVDVFSICRADDCADRVHGITHYIGHGLVALGEPVPVVNESDILHGRATMPAEGCITWNGVRAWVHHDDPDKIGHRDITGAIGDQPIRPGMVAYPVEPA